MKFLTLVGAAISVQATYAKAPKVILDNDWELKSYTIPLLALEAGYDILGLTSNTGDTWSRQAALHGLALLEIGNLGDCIPVYKGPDYPLLNTPERFQEWQRLHGKLAWAGAFAPENRTNEDLGHDPTSGDPNRIVASAFKEGYPNGTLAGEYAAAWMIEQVHKFPGEVLIYAGGALTNVALAVRLDSEFASLTKGLVIMGGYIDSNLKQTVSTLDADLWGDINLMMDPEATKIALTADFPSLIIMGNGANTIFPTTQYIDEVGEVENNYTALFKTYYGTKFPFWDPLALFAALESGNILSQTEFYLDVDTAYWSPAYGTIHAYSETLKPELQKLQKVIYPSTLDAEKFLRQLKNGLQCPKTCEDLKKLRG